MGKHLDKILKHTPYLDAKEIWALKQHLAQDRFYGNGGTIHSSGELDVVVEDGLVRAVWFRCQVLPWRQCKDHGNGHINPRIKITGVEVTDDA